MVPHLVYLKLDGFVKSCVCDQSLIVKLINDYLGLGVLCGLLGELLVQVIATQ